ncbi:MAG: hypothetical protein COA37_07980 [Hoeflea sp.]|uniref:primase-helicase family protein n=1 Tax=Hoeflea sp. TaxID=1940281 RepID=UPI000C0FDFC6|nr:primase-helicase family protein [Hoeflea sp.]PHR23272.1 MAG: hypothetical protein COA37_07980 [Hoeflea sp.]
MTGAQIPKSVAAILRDMGYHPGAAPVQVTPAEAEPDEREYSVDDLNRKFAFVLVGSQALIVYQNPDAPTEERLRFVRPDSFKLMFQNRMTEVTGHDGKIKPITWANRWLSDARRRQYEGLEFYPDSAGADGTPGYLNLWTGFSVDPKPGGTYTVFKDHLLTNVCNGNPDTFKWLWAWFAHMVQRPRERPGTAIILSGGMGTGKTKVGEVFGSLIRTHHFVVDDPRYVTGQFNAFMAGCLFLQAEEAVWAGDKAAEGRLRGLVTSERQMIEAKGVDPIRQPNYVRLLMTSNEPWIVAAGKDERRFATFEVNARCARNVDYFAEMDAELDSGGREALLADLLAFDLSTVNLREIPKTGALLSQKQHSLDSIDAWLMARLQDGAPTRNHSKWPEYVETRLLFDDYIKESDRVGIKRRSAETMFGQRLAKALPGLRRRKMSVPGDADTYRRTYVYVLPSLSECRAMLDETFGQAIDWGENDDE